MTATEIVTAAIETSIREDRIVEIDYSPEVYEALLVEWDDSVEIDDETIDAWGEDEDGRAWRILIVGERRGHLRAEPIDGAIAVTDPEGGRWFPSEEALAEINASADPEATAIRICDEDPTRGTWAQ